MISDDDKRFPKKFHKRKYKIYDPETGWVAGIKQVYFEKDHAPTICGEHLTLLNLVNELVVDPEVKKQLLLKVEIVHDMGKRMGKKLAEYHTKSKKSGGWREDY